MKKLILFVSCSFLISYVFLSVTISTNNTMVFDNYEIGLPLRKDIIEWRFKLENGKRYKRKYNASKGVWIGDWIIIP